MTHPSAPYALPDDLIALLTQYLHERVSTPIHIDPQQLAYRWVGGDNGRLEPITVSMTLGLEDLQGIDTQKAKLVQNTRQFLQGFPANHVLMTGTRGAGKSSLVKALLHRYHKQGLRIIEVARDDLKWLDKIRTAVAALPSDCRCRYIVYCDDLAFNGQDESYRALKTVLDGSLDSEQDKLLVYATSNRRHLLPQLMKDNISIYDGQTDEINPYETVDETVSLSDRFGLWLSFHPMDQHTYLQIVTHYLTTHSSTHSNRYPDSHPHVEQIQASGDTAATLPDAVRSAALRWASQRGGRSGRVAYQFSRYWIGQALLAAIDDDA